MKIRDSELKSLFSPKDNDIWIRNSDNKKFKFVKWIDNNFVELVEI